MASTTSTPLFARRAATAEKLGASLPPLAATPKLTIEIPEADVSRLSRDQRRGSETGSCPALTDGTRTPLSAGSDFVSTPRSPRYTRQQEREWWFQCLEHGAGHDEDCADCVQLQAELPSLSPSKTFEGPGFDRIFPGTEAFPLLVEADVAGVPSDATSCPLSYTERINKSYTSLSDAILTPVAEMTHLAPGWNDGALEFFNQYLRLLVLLLVSVLLAYCVGRCTLPQQSGLHALSITQSMPRVDAFVRQWDWDWANHTQVS